MRKAILIAPALLMTALMVTAGSLYNQSIVQVLERHFPDSEISYLLVDARTRAVVGSRWANLDRPIPLGSLVKPFTAVAYGQSHDFRYPKYICRGEAGGCWYGPGHGRVGITQAVAHSCNAYFRELAKQVELAEVISVLHRFGLAGPPDNVPAPVLAGLGGEWKVEPAALVRAYLEMQSRASEPGTGELVRGMALSAQVGTGRGVGRAVRGAALVKTGTAPCVHEVKWSGDGYVLVLYPAEAPRLALLVQVHGKPGAEAAVIGGRMLRTILDGE